MRVLVVTPPAPVVTPAEVRAHLRLITEADDAYLTALIASAQQSIDGPSGWLGRAIGAQTLEARLDGFDCGSIRLPFPPAIDITSVKYVDVDGTEQTVAGDQYEILGQSLAPAYDVLWPTPRLQREAVRIRYRAGYIQTAEPAADQLPAPIRAAILLMVGDLWHNRDTTTVGMTAAATPMSTTVENLLAPFRAWC